jgi:hypothetical protein
MRVEPVDMPIDNRHIEAERLAAFDQESPTADELAHLAHCAVCRRERQAFESLTRLAHDAGSIAASDAARLTDWDRLAIGLRREGLLASAESTILEPATSAMRPVATVTPLSAAPSVPPSTPQSVTRSFTQRASAAWLRVAAALVLTAGGAMAGRVSVGAPALPLATVSSPSDGSADAGVPATLASAGGDVDGFGSVQQATDVLSRAQREYERASLWLAANDTTVHSSDVYRARLAALDQMMTASRAALRDAPQDPVLNHYFLAAYTAREATLQALGGTLPVDKSLERY